MVEIPDGLPQLLKCRSRPFSMKVGDQSVLMQPDIDTYRPSGVTRFKLSDTGVSLWPIWTIDGEWMK